MSALASSQPDVQKLSPAAWREAVPPRLRLRAHWVGHFDKRPVNPVTGRAARVNNPLTWGTFEQACAFYSKHYADPTAGCGYVLSPADNKVFVDLDHVCDVEQDAGTGAVVGLQFTGSDLVRHLSDGLSSETFAEVSPGGHGIHIFALGALPPDTKNSRKLPGKSKAEVEVWDQNRFVTVTGLRLGSSTDLAAIPARIERIARFLGTKPSPERDPAGEDAVPRDAEIRSMLDAIDPDIEHDSWVRIGMALHAGYKSGATGLRIWDEWSSRGTKYQGGEPADRWRSFKPDGGVGLGTLRHLAMQHGWRPDPTPEQDFSACAANEADPLERVTWKQTKGGPIADKTARNIEYALDHLYGVRLELDTRAGAVLLDGHRLEEGSERNFLAAAVAQVLNWSADPQVASLRAGLAGVAGRHGFDPVVRYLDRLPAWDRVSRFAGLARALGVDEAEAVHDAEMLRLWCVGAVRRAREPGVKMDNVLVLHGEQGHRKTSALQTLAEVVPTSAAPLFTRASAKMKDKDGRIALQGPWIVELAELATLRAAENEITKGFLDEREDWYRPPYGETNVRRPRRVAIAGTTNDDEFLNDPTGARRYWPIATVARIDLEWIRANRDALWAEAEARAKAGEPHWFETTPDWLRARHEEAHEESAIEEEVEQIVQRHEEEWRERGWFYLSDVLLSLPDWVLRAARGVPSNSVGSKLRRLGFRKTTVRMDGTRKKVWWRPSWPAPVEKEATSVDLDDLL